MGWLHTWWPLVAFGYVFAVMFIVFVETKRPKDPSTTWGFVQVDRNQVRQSTTTNGD